MKDEKYIKLREQLKEDHALIAPIRANDLILSHYESAGKLDYKWILENFEAAFNKVASIQVADTKWRALKSASEIVGYFVASKPKGSDHVKFGCSICKLQDLDKYSKELGITLAAEKTWIIPRTLSEANATIEKIDNPGPFYWEGWHDPSKKMTRTFEVVEENGTMKFRCWPVTLLEQYLRFKERCQRYYKN